jgi:translation initiation factor 5A
MADIKIVEARNLKKGNYVVIEGEPCKIVDLTSSKPGKHGAAKIRIVATSIFDGKKMQLLTSGDRKAEVPIISRRNHQVLAISGGNAQLMDTENYETVELPIPEGANLEEGGEVQVMESMGRKVIMTD